MTSLSSELVWDYLRNPSYLCRFVTFPDHRSTLTRYSSQHVVDTFITVWSLLEWSLTDSKICTCILLFPVSPYANNPCLAGTILWSKDFKPYLWSFHEKIRTPRIHEVILIKVYLSTNFQRPELWILLGRIQSRLINDLVWLGIQTCLLIRK